MKHTIQALVENKFGVLARVASLFSARGYNIDSLAVGITADPAVSCMTIVVDAEDERILEQIKKQLHKLIDVITVIDFTRKEYIDRELILCKVRAGKASSSVLSRLSKKYNVKIIEQKKDICFVEICLEHTQLDEVLKELKALGIKEMVRTGKIAIGK
jgi:acetolactate synthase-1/3 small subunit